MTIKRRHIENIAIGVLLTLITLGMWAGDPAAGQVDLVTEDCTVSGNTAFLGTKIFFPERNGDWVIEVTRDGRTLTTTGFNSAYAFARDGEPWVAFHLGVEVDSGVGNGFDCEGETTTTGEVTTTTTADTTTTVIVTTTTQPDDTTTTTQPDNETTTTQPNQPPCDPDTEIEDETTGLCFPISEGG